MYERIGQIDIQEQKIAKAELQKCPLEQNPQEGDDGWIEPQPAAHESERQAKEAKSRRSQHDVCHSPERVDGKDVDTENQEVCQAEQNSQPGGLIDIGPRYPQEKRSESYQGDIPV